MKQTLRLLTAFAGLATRVFKWSSMKLVWLAVALVVTAFYCLDAYGVQWWPWWFCYERNLQLTCAEGFGFLAELSILAALLTWVIARPHVKTRRLRLVPPPK